MDKLINKLNYKGQERIALLNSYKEFADFLGAELNGIQIDTIIDSRFLYDFILIFTDTIQKVDELAPAAIHNLSPDGILWFAFPLKTSAKYTGGPDRENGWESLKNLGFRQVRQVSINTDFTALRFRNTKYIRSSKGTEN